MLSERESHALRQIEQAMRADAPGLAGALMRMEPGPAWYRRRHDALVLVTAVASMLCLAVGAVGAAVVALLFAVTVAHLRSWRFTLD
jgi:Protein of unknown function (DUF3040)